MFIKAFFGKGILGLVQAFAFNWIYFEIDHAHIHLHAIRRHHLSTTVWIAGHLPCIMGYVLAAGALSRLVLAHDCPDANPDHLGEAYRSRSEASLSDGLRWFYCAGLAIALLSMCLLSLSHIHKRVPNARLRKRPRLAIRASVAVIIACLPLAGMSLSSLHLISITTALVVFVLAVDVWGSLSQETGFWTGGFCDGHKRSCEYRAQLHISQKKRREIEGALKSGEKVCLQDVLSRSSSSSVGGSSTTDLDVGVREKGWHGGHF